MRVNTQNLAKLDDEYRGYLKGDAVDAFFSDFEIPFAAGHWCAGEFVDRFASGGYNSNDPNFDAGIMAQIDRVAKAKIKGIEFHNDVFLDKSGQRDESRVREIKGACAAKGLTPTNMNNNVWTDPKWKLGSVTNADPAVRRDALAVALQSVDIAKEVGCASVALWPGSDGWDYNFEVNYGKLLDHFIEACIEINKRAASRGLRFGIEAKLHEPREGNMVIMTTHKATLVAREVNEACGGRNMGVAIDYGHEQMYGNEPADAVYTAIRFGVPVVNFHLNTAKLHSNDEDRVTGTGDIWRLTDFCYAAVDTGYPGWFGEYQFTYRMEQVKAMSLSKELFANVMKKALRIYAIKDKLAAAQATGDAGRTIDVVKEIIL